MKNCLVRLAVFLGLLALLFVPLPAFAGFTGGAMSQPIPQPPAENPHPPQSAEDKRRVTFAEQVIQIQLQNVAALNADSGSFVPQSPVFQNKDLACLRTPACYGKDLAYVQELRQLQDSHGQVIEVRHAHIIPWSFQNFLQRHSKTAAASKMDKMASPAVPDSALQLRDDEYIIHAYVRFSKRGNWNHLDVIIAEDASGNLAFRHFFTVPISYEMHMPPGAVC